MANPKRYGDQPFGEPSLVYGDGITTDQSEPTASRSDTAWIAVSDGYSHVVWTVELPSGTTATVDLYSRLDFANSAIDSMARLDSTTAITATSGIQQHLTARHIAIRVHDITGLPSGEKVRIARSYANFQGT